MLPIPDSATLVEMNARLKRMETRLCKLMEHEGIDPAHGLDLQRRPTQRPGQKDGLSVCPQMEAV